MHHFLITWRATFVYSICRICVPETGNNGDDDQKLKLYDSFLNLIDYLESIIRSVKHTFELF